MLIVPLQLLEFLGLGEPRGTSLLTHEFCVIIYLSKFKFYMNKLLSHLTLTVEKAIVSGTRTFSKDYNFKENLCLTVS